MTFTGLVLAVGVHPFGDPSPIARLFRGDGQAGLSLALRSSTRALPLLVLGLALGTAALVDAIGPCRRLAPGGAGRRRRRRSPLWATFRSSPTTVSSTRRSSATNSPPAAWTDAAAALDALPPGFRVLQLPGAEFGAFTLGIHRRPAAPGADRPAAGDPRPAPPRLAGGDGPALRPRRPLPGRIGRARRRRPDRPPVRRRHDLAARRRRLRPLPHAAARADGRAVRRRRRRPRRPP